MPFRPGQVFGLMDGRVNDDALAYCPPLPDPQEPVLLAKFVSNYRCGAAPE